MVRIIKKVMIIAWRKHRAEIGLRMYLNEARKK